MNESKLSRFKLCYEYDRPHTDIKQVFKRIKHYHQQRIATIRQLARKGTPPQELASRYDMTIQKVTAIIKGKQ